MDFRSIMLIASLASLIRTYRRLRMKEAKVASHIEFCRNCLRNSLTPNWLKMRTPHRGDSFHVDHIEELQRRLLRHELRNWYRMRNLHGKKRIIVEEILQDRLSEADFGDLSTRVCRKIMDFTNFKRRVHKLKISKLMERKRNQTPNRSLESVISGHSFHNRVLNLTDTTFETDELSLLKMGLKFSLPLTNKKKIIEELTVAVESILRFIKFQSVDNVRSSIFRLLDNFKKQNIKHPPFLYKLSLALRSLKTKIKDHNLFLTRADKGNCLVIMSRPSYVEKVTSFLQENNFVLLSTDPLKRYTSRFKNTLSKFGPALFEDWKRFIPMNFNVPRLYGLPKIHKHNVPIRPVVSFRNSLAYKLSKNLNRYISEKLAYHSPHSVKNTADLIEKLRGIRIDNGTTLASLDVSNLFTMVPLYQTLQIFKGILVRSSLPDTIVESIFQLSRLCLEQNFFCFDGSVYSQPQGLSMGNGLSPCMAEIFMAYFERSFVFCVDNPYREKILFWYRYVDDILVGWSGSQDELSEFHNWLNIKHLNMKFTLEIEENDGINFLDLRISKTENRLHFDIYRKPSQTDHSIHSVSCHHHTHKLAAYRSYINRLFKVPMDNVVFTREVSTIKYIAKENGFSTNMIDRLIKKKKYRLLTPNDNNDLNNREQDIYSYISLPFFGKISYQISNILKQQRNVRISFGTVNTLQQLLVKNKDPIPLLDRSGVYKLKCGEPSCNVVYIGRSGRSLRIRIKEHLASQRITSNNRSTFGKHLRECEHTFDPDIDVELLHHIDYGVRQETWEELEIFKHIHSGREELVNIVSTNTTPFLFRIFNNGL